MKNMLVMVSRVNLERPRSGVIIDRITLSRGSL